MTANNLPIWRRIAGHLLLLLWFAGCTTTQQTCNKGCTPSALKEARPRVVLISPDGKKKVTVNIELACTDEDRQQGLMYRKKLGEFDGMLFVFPVESEQSFWMKNTYIPLDMIHINKKKEVVGVVENATPHDLSPRKVSAPALYVLEVNAFFARKHGIYNYWRMQILDLHKQCTSL